MVMQQDCLKINTLISWGFFFPSSFAWEHRGPPTVWFQGQSAALIIHGGCLHAYKSDPLPLQVQRHVHIMELCISLEKEREGKKKNIKYLVMDKHT